MLKNSKILLGLTTTKGSDWVKKINDIDRFNISEVALFLTGIDYFERIKLYELIEKTNLKSIPHVHLRDDMKSEEIEYLINRFDTRVFNIHSSYTDYPFDFNIIKKFSVNIYIENNKILTNKNKLELNNCAGLCVDFAHLESYILNNNGIMDNNCLEYIDIMNIYKIGCCHVSAIKSVKTKHYFNDKYSFDFHKFLELSEFDYLKKI